MCNLHWCYTFCTGVTLFALVLQLNCTALSQSESSNFFMYIIRIFKYYFKNECECFITISKHEKTDESTRPLRPSAFIVFECLKIVMKHDARVFEMTSLKKQYKIMQCSIFSHFSLKCLVCVICCIQSAFIVFVSFCF